MSVSLDYKYSKRINPSFFFTICRAGHQSWKATRTTYRRRSWTATQISDWTKADSIIHTVCVCWSSYFPLPQRNEQILINSEFKLGNFWHSYTNRKRFFDSFAAKKNFSPLVPENWYGVSSAVVREDKVLYKSYPLLHHVLP